MSDNLLIQPAPRTIDWDAGAIVVIDQTLLPGQLRQIRIGDLETLLDAIDRLAIRGAPALGIAGALGVALSARLAERGGRPNSVVREDARRLREVRPTAVNLSWGVDRALGHLSGGADRVLKEALAMRDESIGECHAIGERGADFLAAAKPGKLRMLTHCNAGALACVEWGTALGVIRAGIQRGIIGHVLATETRPLLQGSRLTAWELDQMRVDHAVIVDSVAPWLISQGEVDAVVVGADRIAANGDVANKVGTYSLAAAAASAGIPFIVAAPESTIDPQTPDGANIVVERRPAHEILKFDGFSLAPEGTLAMNFAFDVTPAKMISAIVTDRRLIRPARGERAVDVISLAKAGPF
ncbi:MAG: S-methyl-5-thioribose-1-phosphate isomerase [Candidatus Dormibacteria bacterium]